MQPAKRKLVIRNTKLSSNRQKHVNLAHVINIIITLMKYICGGTKSVFVNLRLRLKLRRTHSIGYILVINTKNEPWKINQLRIYIYFDTLSKVKTSLTLSSKKISCSFYILIKISTWLCYFLKPTPCQICFAHLSVLSHEITVHTKRRIILT